MVPQSADAQRAILEAQLAIAADHLERGHFPEARAAWSEFVAQNPLDARLPAILFQIGESFEKEKQFDRAIAAWEPLTSKFPGSEPAAHAQFADRRASSRTRRAILPRPSSDSGRSPSSPGRRRPASGSP